MKRKYNKPYESTVKENKRILEEYLKETLRNDCAVIFFIPPYSEWYRNRWDYKYKIELIGYLNNLKERYDFDIIDMSEVELPNYYFADYAHLNRLGAIRIANEINKYIICSS